MRGLGDHRLRWAAIGVLALVTLGVVKGRPATTTAAPIDGGSLTAELVADLARNPGIETVTGAYLMGVGAVLDVSLASPVPADVEIWLAEAMSPWVGPISTLPTAETVLFVIEAPDATIRMVAVPPGTAMDTGTWTERSATSVASGGAGGVRVATGEPTDAPAGGAAAPASATVTTPVVASTAPASTDPPGEFPTAPSAGSSDASVPTGGDAGVAPSGGVAGWSRLTGSWEELDGVLRQTDTSGYDFIAESGRSADPGSVIEVRLRAVDDSDLSAGLIVGQPTSGTRAGATMIDLTGSNGYLRWGTYDATTSVYGFTGGVTMAPSVDPTQWHVLRVELTESETVVIWDGAEVGRFGPTPSGGIGFVTSLAAAEFSDLTVVPL